jgi:hypothetical protein
MVKRATKGWGKTLACIKGWYEEKNGPLAILSLLTIHSSGFRISTIAMPPRLIGVIIKLAITRTWS